MAKWMRFCDEDMRIPLPAEEGDVLAYVGYLAIEGKVSPESLPQYLSAVSRYHELHHLPSPTRTPLVRALQRAYQRAYDTSTPARDIRVGCPATVMRQIVMAGLGATDPFDVTCCAMATFAFIFQARSISVAHFRRDHLVVDDAGLQVSLFRRKGKSVRRPLILRYDINPAWPSSNPVALVQRWAQQQTEPSASFSTSLTDALQRALLLSAQTPPSGCVFSSHSPRIGGYNALLGLQFPKEWIMRRLDWESDQMLRVYLDTTVSVTDDSRWFFAHLRPSA